MIGDHRGHRYCPATRPEPAVSMRMRPLIRKLAILAFTAGLGQAVEAGGTLVGRAVLPAASFASGPTSGQFTAGANGHATPFHDRQPVQGISAILDGPLPGTYHVMMDNGFGTRVNSADVLLRVFAVRPDFATGIVHPVDFRSGVALPDFTADSYITLHDPDRQLGFPIVADRSHYPGSILPVDPAIAGQRQLTGADLDIESMRRTGDGSLWFGDEFGPFLIRADANGKVLQAPVPLPNRRGLGPNPHVQSPQNPALHPVGANLPASAGFEGLALNASGSRLHTLLERPLTADADSRRLLMDEFDPGTGIFTGRPLAYRLDPRGTAIGDFTAINDREFLVIERDGGQGDPWNPAFPEPALFKRIFKVDLSRADAEGFVEKTELVDLMNIADPADLDGDGLDRFTFPFVTTESVLVVDADTLLVVNDNNFPFSTGRTPGMADPSEFILIRLDRRLSVGSEAGATVKLPPEAPEFRQ